MYFSDVVLNHQFCIAPCMEAPLHGLSFTINSDSIDFPSHSDKAACMQMKCFSSKSSSPSSMRHLQYWSSSSSIMHPHEVPAVIINKLYWQPASSTCMIIDDGADCRWHYQQHAKQMPLAKYNRYPYLSHTPQLHKDAFGKLLIYLHEAHNYICMQDILNSLWPSYNSSLNVIHPHAGSCSYARACLIYRGTVYTCTSFVEKYNYTKLAYLFQFLFNFLQFRCSYTGSYLYIILVQCLLFTSCSLRSNVVLLWLQVN